MTSEHFGKTCRLLIRDAAEKTSLCSAWKPPVHASLSSLPLDSWPLNLEVGCPRNGGSLGFADVLLTTTERDTSGLSQPMALMRLSECVPWNLKRGSYPGLPCSKIDAKLTMSPTRKQRFCHISRCNGPPAQRLGAGLSAQHAMTDGRDSALVLIDLRWHNMLMWFLTALRKGRCSYTASTAPKLWFQLASPSAMTSHSAQHRSQWG